MIIMNLMKHKQGDPLNNVYYDPRIDYKDPDPHDICLVGVIEELKMCLNGQYQCVLDNYQIKELIDDIFSN